MAQPEHFLFVSHVSEDRAAALAIVDELERRRIPCWIAPRNIDPGRPFDDAIVEAIESSRAILLIFSDLCNESEYIRREVTVAGESHKLIIPFRIEDAQPRRGLRVRLSDLHWLDGFAARERAIEELATRFGPDGAVHELAAPPAAHREPPQAAATGASTGASSGPIAATVAGPAVAPRASPQPRVALFGGAAALGLAGIAAVIWFLMGTAEKPPPTLPQTVPANPGRTVTAPAAPPPPAVAPPPAAAVTPPPAPVVSAGAAVGEAKAAFERQDFVEAMRWDRQAAERDDPTAQTMIGYLYEKGLGVPQDVAEAAGWYRKAAEQGHAAAQRNLGALYEQGIGVPQDYAEALRWYRLAAEQGNAGAETNLGYLLEHGLGAPQDYGEALRWYEKAAKQGEAMAQNNIGAFYDKGYGVPQDAGEALHWYRKAAQQGNVDAEYNLALLYAEGRGVAADLDEAHAWMQKAAAAGDAEAKKWLDAHGG